MANLVLVVVGLAIALGGLRTVYSGWKGREQRRLVTETPTTEVRQLREEGTVELVGRIDESADVFTSPIGQEDAVLAAWEVEEWSESNDSNRWNTTASGVYATPFAIDDGTDRVRVVVGDHITDPGGSLLGGSSLTGSRAVTDDGVVVDTVTCEFEEFPVAEEVGAESEPPEHIREFVAGERGVSEQTGSITNLVDVGNAHGDRRYSERALGPGEEVYVLGHAEADADATRPLHPEDVTVVPTDDEPFIVSDQSEDALTDDFGSSYRRTLALGVVFVVGGIVGIVAGATPLL